MTLTQQILTKMMELPHRGSGTVFETKAEEYLKNVYTYFGMQPKEVEFSTIPNSLNNHLIISFSLILLTIAVNFLNITILTLIVFVVAILVYLRLFNLPFRFMKKRSTSKDLYVEVASKNAPLYNLVITGHYDTGNDYGPIISILGPLYNYLIASQFNNRDVRQITLPEYVNNPLIFTNISIILTGLALFIPDSASKLFFAMLAGAPLIIGLILLLRSNNKYAPGAYDNGVGTSMVVELASIFSKAPLENTRLIFANIGAEETLTRGIMPLLNSLNLERANTLILDLDCLGEDELVLMHSEPSYPLGIPIEYDISFDILTEFAESYMPNEYKVSSSPAPTDNQEAINAGFRVLGLLTSLPIKGYPVNYHNSKDVIERIKWDKVEQTRDFLTAFIPYLDTLTAQQAI